jgi:hypothetical protein
LPVVLYGCETWSLTLREEHRLREFENRVLRRIFRPKWDEVTGEWRRLHNKGLYHLYSSPNNIRVTTSRVKRLVGHVEHVGEGVRTGFWWNNMRETDHLEEVGVVVTNDHNAMKGRATELCVTRTIRSDCRRVRMQSRKTSLHQNW